MPLNPFSYWSHASWVERGTTILGGLTVVAAVVATIWMAFGR